MEFVTVTCVCPLCGRETNILVEEFRWNLYEAGALIQDAFPTTDIHTRETLISGMCLPCQESFFVEDEDDCNGVCELCSLGDDCPNSTNY